MTKIGLRDWALLIAVWKAVEGDHSELIAFLRSDIALTQWSRDLLADWGEGKIQPVKLPKGRPPENSCRYQLMHRLLGIPLHLSLMATPSDLTGGHDPKTPMGRAGIYYNFYWSYIRKKGWNRQKAGRPHWSPELLKEKIADKHGINLDKFRSYMSRSLPKPKPEAPIEKLVEAVRRDIAYEIRRAKIPQNG